ncbi:cell division protein FtsQ/DivIB [Asticcacaulis sp. EMRT-3]|uniref:cell division protein FtsQ/DivIB n=1 Tax=Asticcacaulis sp. EMRT-3 TaxID=3040349 RepID=UPI0024AFF4E2|nr:cell division protein FtsQ/DivIB [Asticcacaulis sp. EMRT-3]MDI7775277.1 cell division protein FtsQ/DivIB [Asticcacaulis sp. EMRT-3]
MPAVVRGGRRQASSAQSAGAGKAAGKTAGLRRAGKGRAPQAGKSRLLGAVPMPGELTGWLAVLVIAGLLAAVLLTGHRAEALGRAMLNFADDRMASLGVKLENVRLAGVSDEAAPDIKKALDFHRGQPFVFMDLSAVQAAVENVGWVKSATIHRQFPNTLIVSVVERPRLAVWQYNGREQVIDDTGQVIPEANAVKFPNLPLIVGEGANETASDIIQLVQARPDLYQRIFALQRVDTRRWNIILKNGTVIKLPALNQDQALGRLDVLIAQQRVLDQGLAEIDLLDPTALVVVPLEARPSHPATATPAT